MSGNDSSSHRPGATLMKLRSPLAAAGAAALLGLLTSAPAQEGENLGER
jgi:hypothetical protein